MSQKIEDQSVMTRKEFLTTVGTTVGVFAAGWFISSIPKSLNTNSSKTNTKVSSGYGSSAYGGQKTNS